MFTARNLVVSFFVLLTNGITFSSAMYPDELIKVTGRRIYLTGQKLVLNCTTITKTYNNRNLLWDKDGKELRTKTISSDTLQVIKYKVKKTDEGRYRCVVSQRARVLRSESVYVTVGDIPPKPTNIGWSEVDWSICLHWSPVITTSNFPVTYRVRYRCVSECGMMLDANPSNKKWLNAACMNAPPNPVQRLSCCLNDVNLSAVYEAVVDAVNIFGSSSSKPLNFTIDVQVKPEPPRSLEVLAEGYGEISLDWTNSHTIGLRDLKYIIYYSTQGDKKNKTITVDSNGQNFYRIRGLKPYTKYTIYLAATRFKEDGIPAGPVTIVTREENPSDAPEITEWQSVMYQNKSSKLRKVTIKWKLPPKEEWNGRITKYIIQYRRIPGRTEEATTVNSWGQQEVINSSTTEGTLIGLRADSAYSVDMRMCNRAGCGGIGKRIIIKADNELMKGEIKQDTSESVVILCIFVTLVAMLVIVFAVVIFLIAFKRTQPVTSTKTTLFLSKGSKV